MTSTDSVRATRALRRAAVDRLASRGVDVPRRINTQNRRRPLARSSTGLLGVTAKPDGRFVAQLTYQGKNLYLGRFSTPEEAHAAYLKAKRQLHEGCTI